MANVNANLDPTVRYIGKPAEAGGPIGYFGGRSGVEGDDQGGINSVSIRFLDTFLQGKILVFRHISAITNATTARACSLAVSNGYFLENDTGYIATPTVVGPNKTIATLASPASSLLFFPEQNLLAGNVTILQSAMVNTDMERQDVYVMGEIWEESRLRQAGHGPLIRW